MWEITRFRMSSSRVSAETSCLGSGGWESAVSKNAEATDEHYRLEALRRLCRIPSAVPLGPNTLMEPDDPILLDYVRQGPRSEFDDLGVTSVVELPMNQFAVRFGSGHGPCLALMAYTPTQHNNLMEDPWSGNVRIPVE